MNALLIRSALKSANPRVFKYDHPIKPPASANSPRPLQLRGWPWQCQGIEHVGWAGLAGPGNGCPWYMCPAQYQLPAPCVSQYPRSSAPCFGFGGWFPSILSVPSIFNTHSLSALYLDTQNQLFMCSARGLVVAENGCGPNLIPLANSKTLPDFHI